MPERPQTETTDTLDRKAPAQAEPGRGAPVLPVLAALAASAAAGLAWALSPSLVGTMPQEAGTPEAGTPEAGTQEAGLPASDLPDWRTVSAAGFGAKAKSIRAGWINADESQGQQPLTEATIRSLGVHLDGPAETATRAAVLLGVAMDVAAAGDDLDGAFTAAKDLLVQRLMARNTPASRAENGVDIVAAGALGPYLVAGSTDAASAVELASGSTPHPNLAVRVECAAAALEFARAWEVTSFLISVLRTETPDESKSPRTWPRIQTLAWVKTRAADALSRALGTDMRFRPDGPWEHQTDEVDRLERLVDDRDR